MDKLYFGILFLLLPMPVFSQVKLHFADSEDGAALAQVHLLVFRSDSTKQVLVSGKDGMLNMKDIALPFSYQVSLQGYKMHDGTIESSGDHYIQLYQDSKILKEVVVTGQYRPQSMSKSVNQIRVIDKERIEKQGATKIQDILYNELNFRFSQDLALGESRMQMQGLSGQNIKVLMDGVPMIGRQGTSNEININQVDINSVERIEIVEGPMATIYGSDALAGVINIITKKPENDKISVSARMHEETVGDEYGSTKGIHNQHVSIAYGQKGWQLSGAGGRNYFGGWLGNSEGREKEWNPKTQWLGNFRAGYQHDDLDIWYRMDGLQETIENPGAFSGNEAIDQLYITQRFSHQLQSNYQPRRNLSINTALAYTDFSRRTQTSTVNRATGAVRLALGEGLQELVEFNGLTLRGTATYKWSPKVSVQPGVDINLESGEGGRIKTGTQRVDDYAAYVTAEISPLSWLSIKPGFRFIYNSVYNAPPIVPSFNGKISISENMDVKASYGRGFRAPSIRELYFNFFDASHAIEGNPDLQAELSHSFNAAFNWKIYRSPKTIVKSSLSSFYNHIDNLIAYGQKPGNSFVTTYINIDKYKTKGMVLSNDIIWKDLSASVGVLRRAQYNQFSDRSENLDQFVWSTEVNANVGYVFPKIGASLNVFYKFTGKMPFYELANVNGSEQIRLAELEDFHWTDITLNKKLGKYLGATGGVRNLFNVQRINNTSVDSNGAHSTGGARPVGYGRSFFLSMNFQFN